MQLNSSIRHLIRGWILKYHPKKTGDIRIFPMLSTIRPKTINLGIFPLDAMYFSIMKDIRGAVIRCWAHSQMKNRFMGCQVLALVTEL